MWATGVDGEIRVYLPWAKLPPGDQQGYETAARAVQAASEPWIRCLDDKKTGRIYPLNPEHVVFYRPSADGYWQARDVLGLAHQISTDDHARVEALAAPESALVVHHVETGSGQTATVALPAGTPDAGVARVIDAVKLAAEAIRGTGEDGHG